MSKINTFRVINLNYNNNANRIDDEIFHLNGDSTLLSLQNGGGKTVLVQMLIAPFVHKRYRNTTDRSFESFFTSNKPTFLLVEWILDGGAGYVLTGMMIRKNQGGNEEISSEDLDITTFIHEYRGANEFDIYQIPVIEKQEKQKKLLGYHSCKKLFDEMRNKLGGKFKAFDLSQSNQQKHYFLCLKEYGINSEEWESIIKKINIKESGLSELFKEAKDENGLVEKWFLPAIETKLNKEENRIKQFHSILSKFIWQYKENEVKIKRKTTILEFRQDVADIEEKTSECLDLSNQVSEKEEQIAYLRHNILQMLEEVKIKEEQSNEVLKTLENNLFQVNYEEISYAIYQLIEELEKQLTQQNEVSVQRDETEKMLKYTKKLLHIEECARFFEEYKQEENDVLKLESKYEVMKKEEEELIPERTNLGYSLHLAYSEQVEVLQKERQELENVLENLLNEQVNIQEKEKVAGDKLSDSMEKIGTVKAEIKQYDEEENRFNEKFPLKLERNIMGVYEEGLFELIGKNQETQIDTLKHDYLIASQNQKKSEEEREIIQRNIQDSTRSLGEMQGTKKILEEKNKKFHEELEIRRGYMKYLSIPEEKQFDKAYICSKFEEKTESLKNVLRNLEKENEKSENIFNKMKHGIVIELPKEVEQHLRGLDVNYVTGMDYIKLNGYEKDQNQELLKNMPLLPYSIIMSERELNKLTKAEANFYTSYPIPILIKEELTRFSDRSASAIFRENKLNFFVVFNEHLLNEKELELLLQKKEIQINAGKEHIKKKKEEIEYYESRANEIMYQECNEDKYKEIQIKLEQIYSKNEMEEKNLIQLRIDKSNNEKSIEILRGQCQNIEISKKILEEMHRETIIIEKKYQQYLLNLSQRIKLNQEIEQLTKELENSKKEISNIYNKLGEKKLQISDLESIYKQALSKKNKYASYTEGTKINKDLVKIEKNYEAITENMRHDVKLIEEQLEQARNRFVKKQDQLINFASVNDIKEEEYKENRYSSFREKELEQQLAEYENQFELLKKQWHAIDKKIGIQESKITQQKNDLQKKFERSEPEVKEKIIDIMFATRIKLIQNSIYEEDKKKKEFIKKRIGYEANISALSEFSDFLYKKEFDFISELANYHKSSLYELKRNELEEFYGVMIRGYRSLKVSLDKHRLALERALDALLLLVKYKEDFYRQPLLLIRQLTEKPDELLNQLAVTLQSYQNLLEKLEVDIAFIDREKEKITEMLCDYVQEIYKNLDKIDRNSTITVKERSIKMLKIQVPSWEENKELYLQRINTFTTELIISGLKCIEDNHNLEEMIGIRVTSKVLYDTAVGIGTTVIKLYKIEAQREYPITWAEVSKNSGGEGFLSAFVVLTSLLSYMRKDESDLFIEREEGKVLVMDNPFAQTNASHLLIPLMDIARKCNTQLICLTGLGGESIYNRFDNIYVLNLIESGLQRDVSYLKADRVKGDAKVYQMASTRMQVEETQQLELEF